MFKDPLFPVCFVALSLLQMSMMDGANLNLCRFNSTDYVVTLHSTGEVVCCRERTCPPGHYAEPCSPDNPETSICHLCSPGTFQPRPNLLGTKCIQKISCDGSCTKYKHQGTSTEDAECECKQGCYWDEDSSSCKKNKLCPPGYEIDDQGGCTECNHGTFSDTNDNLEKCRPHTKCENFNRCVRIPGNTTDDNVCCDQQQADINMKGIVSVSPLENGYLRLNVLLVSQVVILTIAAIIIISILILIFKRMKRSNKRKGSIFTCHTSAKFRRGPAEDYIPIDCTSELSCLKGTSCPDETNNQYCLDVADSEDILSSTTRTNYLPSTVSTEETVLKSPFSSTGMDIVPRKETSEATGSESTQCFTVATSTGPWADRSELTEEQKVLLEEQEDDITHLKILPTEDGVKLPEAKIIDESLRCKTVIPMSIPESLNKNLLQLKFVDMFGFGKDSFEVYVCSKQFGKHTEPEVKKLIKDLVKAHGMLCKCDVIVSVTPKRLSFMCGKKPSRPGAKIVMKGIDEKHFGSLGGYVRTSKGDSRVYVITNEHVANKGVKVRVIQPCVAGTEDTCTDVHYGTCRWAIKTGSAPSRYVDIAAIEVHTLGWRSGIKDGPGESVFNGNIESVMGQLVYKYGAQTGLTYGKVRGHNFVVRGEDDESNYQGLVLVEGLCGAFCNEGDSGSFVRLQHGDEPLAIVVGGEIEDREATNSDFSRFSACYLLSKSLMELEKVSGTKWILEDEAHLQCLLPGRYSDRC